MVGDVRAGGSSEVLTQAQVESEIQRIAALLEPAVVKLAEFAEEAADAEVTYKVRYAQEVLAADERFQKDREARAVVNTEAYLRRRLEAEAHHATQRELLRALQTQLDALRTIAANIRAQT